MKAYFNELKDKNEMLVSEVDNFKKLFSDTRFGESAVHTVLYTV